MAEMTVRLKSEAGATLTQDRGPGDTNHTLKFFPGSALRGAIATRYLYRHGADQIFHAAFVDEGVHFGNLYPVREMDIEGLAFPTPLSARTCKYQKGFRGQPPAHGVQDFLFRAALYQLGAPAGVLLSIDRCLCCEQPLDRLDGFVYRRGPAYWHREATSRLLTRVAIDRYRGMAAEGILYNLEVLNEDQLFQGSISSVNGIWLDAIRGLANGCPLRVGAAKTRGLGLVTCTIEEASIHFPDFQQRINRLQDEMKKLATKYPPAEKSFQAFHFSLTLESDALLIDSYLRAKTGLDSVTLAAALGGIPAEELRPVVHFSGTRMVHGWNIALGLPKPDALAIVKGSTFLFAYTGREVARLQTALGRLEEEGIGLRRGEGFGRLVVCHPFHWEVREHE